MVRPGNLQLVELPEHNLHSHFVHLLTSVPMEKMIIPHHGIFYRSLRKKKYFSTALTTVANLIGSSLVCIQINAKGPEANRLMMTKKTIRPIRLIQQAIVVLGILRRQLPLMCLKYHGENN